VEPAGPAKGRDDKRDHQRLVDAGIGCSLRTVATSTAHETASQSDGIGVHHRGDRAWKSDYAYDLPFAHKTTWNMETHLAASQLVSAAYDAGNQIVNWSGTSFSEASGRSR
jgi:hypothetical protein